MAKKKATRKTAAAKDGPDLSHIVEDLRPLARPIGHLELDPKNARKHTDNSTKALATSLKKFGQRKPVVVNSNTGHVQAGNGTVLAARQLGWTHLAVVTVVDDPDTDLGFKLADNHTADLSEWDDGVLQELLLEYQQADAQTFDNLGFFELLVEDAVQEAAVKPLTIKPPPPMTWVLVGLPTTRYGEISQTVEQLAEIPEIVVELASNEHEPNKDG